MKQRFVALLALIVLAIAAAARAEIKCASVFGDHMVLQRDLEVPVWGTATAGEKVTVTINGQNASANAEADGKWMVKLPPMPAGGPTQLVVAGENTITFDDVLIGDVWICSGQSNMEWPLRLTDYAQQEIAAADFPRIRLATVQKATEEEPKDSCNISWSLCMPESARHFSAVGYFFGRHLHQQLDVPIGLINTSWGGTPAEAWTDSETLRADPDFTAIIQRRRDYPREYPQLLAKYEEDHRQWTAATQEAQAQGQPTTQRAPRKPPEPGKNPHLASVLYNGMVHPLVPFGIRGAIWYQGESNAGRAYQYRRLLPAMIGCWRSAWGQGDFPFLIVQLANYGKNRDDLGASDWAELREAQLVTAQTVPNCGIAVTIDIGNPGDIHPTNKQDVGRRLALAAEKLVYGHDVVHSGPIYNSMSIDGNKARVTFDHTGGGLVVKGERLTGFIVAGEDRKFVEADAVTDGNCVVVSSPLVAAPAAVRYGWRNSPDCNLYNVEGLPAAPFRTDDWPGVTVEAK